MLAQSPSVHIPLKQSRGFAHGWATALLLVQTICSGSPVQEKPIKHSEEELHLSPSNIRSTHFVELQSHHAPDVQNVVAPHDSPTAAPSVG